MGLTVTFFDGLTLVGGLSLFLFGMTVMGQSLERRAGSGLRLLLSKLTSNKFAGLLTGMGITAVIQSSSATTVMVVGFVNSGLMSLKQSINVIMGANVGTTITAWILSLSSIDSKNFFVSLFKPTSFSPVLAFIGIVFLIGCKAEKKKDTGMILLGFATLMFGMETMSAAVSGLGNVPEFQSLFLLFTNPLLGLLAGTVLTAVIQSSSASVGILQVLAHTGKVSYGAAIPIIMGQNIGTCVTALISSIGANKNAKRAAVVHLAFNVIGALAILAVYLVVEVIFRPEFLGKSASLVSIAVIHSVFNLVSTLFMLPLSGFLEKLVCWIIPQTKEKQTETELDDRLLATPSLALDQCSNVMSEMADCAINSLYLSLESVDKFTEEKAEIIREAEEITDHYEDIIGTYLVKLSSRNVSENDSAVAAEYLKLIGDFERIADHGVNILESAEEISQKGIEFSKPAREELKTLMAAVRSILQLSQTAFQKNDLQAAGEVEALEQVIRGLREKIRTRHIQRLQRGECSIDAGFVWSDLLTSLGRVAGHCSNIAGCLVDSMDHTLNLHESQRDFREDSEEYRKAYKKYNAQYLLS